MSISLLGAGNHVIDILDKPFELHLSVVFQPAAKCHAALAQTSGWS